jgi:hypothetical protein
MAKTKKRSYVPPQIVDLSNFTATGQDPRGACTAGAVPLGGCDNGPSYVAPPCSPGSGVDTSACPAGYYHAIPTCSGGGAAANVCISGGQQQ